MAEKQKEKLIKKILVALDGSKPSDNALDLALDLAEKYSAEILLLRVVPTAFYPYFIAPEAFPRAFPFVIPPAVINSSARELEAGSEGVLSEALKKAEKVKSKSNVSTKLVTGRIAEKIIQTAKEGNVDIVVMGSRGLSGIKKFFLGSFSDKVADEAPCPVLIVK
ncbi:MAG: universal stress protein [Candidatus Bathyarchaeota archaeon]|nr:universal stress protein [Candidatus Bathyarchaeota archaeon]